MLFLFLNSEPILWPFNIFYLLWVFSAELHLKNHEKLMANAVSHLFNSFIFMVSSPVPSCLIYMITGESIQTYQLTCYVSFLNNSKFIIHELLFYGMSDVYLFIFCILEAIRRVRKFIYHWFNKASDWPFLWAQSLCRSFFLQKKMRSREREVRLWCWTNLYL